MSDAVLNQFTQTVVEEAEAVGEVRGRNAKIVEKLRKSNQGDGTANLSGKSSANAQTAMPELGAIDRYNGNTNIWERGGEKRRRITRIVCKTNNSSGNKKQQE